MFLTLEGVEGAGKSTLIRLLAKELEARGRDVLITREPGGSALGREIRPLLVQEGRSLATAAELFLFLADRAQHVAEVLRPALECGKTVICDRFTHSTLAYQGYGRGLDLQKLKTLNDMACRGLEPDLTLVLDLPVAEGLSRAQRRNAQAEDREGRFEAEALAFHERIRKGFLDMAGQDSRMQVLDARRSPQELLHQALHLVERV